MILKSLKKYITIWHLLGVAVLVVYIILANTFFGYTAPTMILVGLPCPACGLTRSGLLFFSGNFIESFRMHPLFIPTLLFAVCAVICRLFKPEKFEHIKTLAIVLLISFFIVYFIRMALLFPYNPPMTINSDSIFHNLLYSIRETT